MSAIYRALHESARPPFIAGNPNAHWFVVATVCLGAFMGQLDASIVTLALPNLSTDFHVPIGAVEWVSLSYLLVLVATVAVVGRAADIVGRKLLYVYGFGVFVLGSVLCGLAPGLGWLIAARVLQAFGAAMLQANSVALIVHAMPKDKLGRGLGVQGAAQAFGLALGPAIGGVIVGLAGWRLIFFVNVPVGVVGMVLGWFLLPRSRELEAQTKFDWPGTFLLIPAVAAVLLSLSEAARVGWESTQVLVLVLVAALLWALFVARERRTETSLIDLRLFRQANFSAGIVSGLLAYLVLFGALFVIPFYLETSRHRSAIDAGLELAVLPVMLGIVAPLAGQLMDRLGIRIVTTSGMGLVAIGLFMMALVPHGIGPRLAALAIVGSGLGCFTPANNTAIMTSAPRHNSGMAGGILNMTRGLGTALGVALAGLVYTAASGATGAGQGSGSRGFVVSMIALGTIAIVAAFIANFQSGLRRSPTLAGPHL
jgi:EmrB/QacA subfamily drug resistance transporter